jgi:hypothetical protein
LQRIEFARTKSDAVAKLDGSYKPDKERKKKGEAARGEQQQHACIWQQQQQWRQQRPLLSCVFWGGGPLWRQQPRLDSGSTSAYGEAGDQQQEYHYAAARLGSAVTSKLDSSNLRA